MRYDVAAIRSRFPSLGVTVDGRPIAYFDGPGGTQVPQAVIDAVVRYYREMNANHEGAFVTSRLSDASTEAARAAAADFLGAPSPQQVKFGANMTTLTLHASRSIGATFAPGDEVVVTTLDHEANVGPWHSMARDHDLVIRTVDIREDDVTLDLEHFDSLLSSKTKLVAIGWASNAVGTVNPVAEIVRRAHEVGALTYVDAVAWAPHGPIDVTALDTDFLACSAYKFYGPHAGLLYGRQDVLDRLPSYKIRPAFDRYETGTANFECIAGIGAAIEHLAWVGREYGAAHTAEFPGTTGRVRDLRTGMAAIREHEMALFGRLLDGVEAIPGIRVYGITDRARFAERVPTLALRIDGVAPVEAATALGDRGLTTWDGHFYAQALIERLGLYEAGGVLRIGLAQYTTADEIDRLLGELETLARG